MLRHSGVAGEMHRHWARMRHAAERRRGRIYRMRHGPASKHRRHGHRTRQGGGLARPSESLRDTTGQEKSLIEAGTVVASEAVAGPGRHPRRAVGNRDPGRHRRRTRGRRPMSKDTPRSPQATARQLHRRASRSNAGPDRPRRRTADRPAKLTRTPARAADAAPGAVDSLPFPPKKLPEAQPASLRRTAFRAVSDLPDCSTRGL